MATGAGIELCAEGMTCILIAHEMCIADEVADRIYFTDVELTSSMVADNLHQ